MYVDGWVDGGGMNDFWGMVLSILALFLFWFCLERLELKRCDCEVRGEGEERNDMTLVRRA